jgi:predicted SprT family Zn-dependent metalloprotease
VNHHRRKYFLDYARRALLNYQLHDWRVQITRKKRQLGYCNYLTRTIALSGFHLDTDDDLEIADTILHEIAHAIAGSDAGHSEKWVRVARAIGCSGMIKASLKLERYPWISVCATCGRVLRRVALPKLKQCKACGASIRWVGKVAAGRA